jgi:hypothetical protein
MQTVIFRNRAGALVLPDGGGQRYIFLRHKRPEGCPVAIFNPAGLLILLVNESGWPSKGTKVI